MGVHSWFRTKIPSQVRDTGSFSLEGAFLRPQTIARMGRKFIWVCAVGMVLGLALISGLRTVVPGKKTQSVRENLIKTSATAPEGPVTFNRAVAPIVFQKCAGCHRPGQSAPFALLTYQEVYKHARQIAEVTQRH